MIVTTANTLWLVDGHVHLYRRHDLDRLLLAAHANLRRYGSGARFAVLVASAKGTVDTQDVLAQRLRHWCLNFNADGTLRACGPVGSTIEMHFGRQMVSSERLELLVFGGEVSAREGPMLDLAERALDAGALVILPWGAGKWWGKRGRLVKAACERFSGRSGFLLADSAVRPRGWRAPAELAMAARMGVPVVSGTDPLPVRKEVDRVGSYCFEVQAGHASSGNLIDAMCAPDTKFIVRGSRMSLVSFFRTQALLRLQGHE